MDRAESDLSESLPDAFWQGVSQFNQGHYYDCHDTLEALWMEADPAERQFYQGILQIAVGLYHLGNGNWQGAATLLGEGRHRLSAYGASHQGIDVDDLRHRTGHWLAALHQLGKAEVAGLVQAVQGNTDTAVAGLETPLPALRIRRIP